MKFGKKNFIQQKSSRTTITTLLVLKDNGEKEKKSARGCLHKQQNRQFKITGQFCVENSRSDEQLLIPTNYIIDSYVYQTRV